jgi:cell fate regulator YaaT (PSP1 superfamily)
MGCTSCGTKTDGGMPRGCQNNGTCSSGGCDKLEVYDWLANVSLPNGQAPYDIVEIRFKNSRKTFFKNSKNIPLQAGAIVVVEGNPGFDVGVVSVVGELARIQVAKKEPGFNENEAKKIIRIATQEDIDNWTKARALEKDVMFSARTLAVNLGLQMKISDVEYQGDLTKATFYYTADGRVDFRQLIKDMADAFKIRIEMRQIGARQEAARLGAIGSCGRELCCSTWLSDFRSVSTSAARYQQLSLNPQKLAGQCGKLKCCLNYELDMYLEELKSFPKADTRLYTEKGMAYHVKTDVFKRQMWYAYQGEAGIGVGLILLAPERVKEIIALNKQGEKPKDLEAFVEQEEVVVKQDYENVVGQDSLNRFEHAFKSKNKKKKKKPNAGGNAQQVSQQHAAENRPQEQRKEAKKGNHTGKERPNNEQNKPKEARPQGRDLTKMQSKPQGEGQQSNKDGEQKNRRNNPRRKPNNRPKPSDGGENRTNEA